MVPDLANELILIIARFIELERDVNALARANRQLYNLLNRYLYQRDVRKYGSLTLIWAAQHGNKETAQRTLEAGASINAKATPLNDPPANPAPVMSSLRQTPKKDCYTPLSAAVISGQEGMVQFFLSHQDIDVNLCDEGVGRTPLTLAVESGNVNVVRLLLEAKTIKPDLADETLNTPLMLASAQGCVEIVKLLLTHDEVDANTGNWWTKTPIWLAASLGHVDVVRLLLDAGASPQGLFFDDDPLQIAAVRDHTSVVKEILKSPRFDAVERLSHIESLRCMAAGKGLADMFEAFFKVYPYNINWHNGQGGSALWWAAARGQEGMVRLILSAQGLNVNPANRGNVVPDCEMTASVHAAGHVEFGSGTTALMAAAQQGHLGIVRLLLAMDGIDIHACDMSGRTALKIAISKGHGKIAQLLELAQSGNTVSQADSRCH